MLKTCKIHHFSKKLANNFLKRQLSHTERIVNVNGFNINTLEVNSEGEKVALLLPGTAGTAWTDFKPQIENLPKLLPNHKLIFWDPPGFGKSVPPEREFNTNCFKNDAKCAVELMRQLSYDKFSLLGWSAGGMTALIIAGRHPELVEKLVIWGAGPQLSKQDFLMTRQLRNVKNVSEAMRKPYELAYGEERFAEIWRKCMDTLGTIYIKQNGDICIEDTKKIIAPTLILRGKKDAVYSADFLPFLFEHLPCYKYFEFPEGKHNIHLRYPDEFNQKVAEFLLQDPEQLKQESHKKGQAQLNENLKE